jgi:predicted Zn finger-like uncharacterized protein
MVRIACDHCRKVFRVPADKLPRGRRFTFPCPACKHRIAVDLREAPEPGAPPAAVTGDKLRKKINRTIKDLPPVPQVVQKAQEIMANPESGLKELAKTLETDQAIVAKVLRLANSSYYGWSGKIATIQRALVLLGEQTLKEVILTAGMNGLLDKTLKGYGFASGELWRHSIAVGMSSKIITSRIDPERANDAFVAGLIHDAGKLALDPFILEERAAFDAFMQDEQQTFLKAEHQILGFDHAELVQDLCRKWNFPDDITTAVTHHHRPSRSHGSALAYAVHLADYIARSGGLGFGSDDYLYQLEDGTLKFLGLEQDVIRKIVLEIMETMMQYNS